MSRQLSPDYPPQNCGTHAPFGLRALTLGLLPAVKARVAWKLPFTKMDGGDCGMVKTVEGIVKNETLAGTANADC
jgi:hypothetical protein